MHDLCFKDARGSGQGVNFFCVLYLLRRDPYGPLWVMWTSRPSTQADSIDSPSWLRGRTG